MRAEVFKMIKKNISQAISDKFDIPLDGIASEPNVQMIGNTLMTIDGCIGIKKYETDEIIIQIPPPALSYDNISDSNFTLKIYKMQEVSCKINIRLL